METLPLTAINRLTNAFYSYPVDAVEMLDAMSSGQLDSKSEAFNVLKAHLTLETSSSISRIHHLGCWHGLLSAWVKEYIFVGRPVHCNLVDVNDEALDLAIHVHHGLPTFTVFNTDAANYLGSMDLTGGDLVINTSCEHMTNEWVKKLPSGCLVLAQSNDYDIPEHINTSAGLGSFLSSLGFETTIHASARKHSKYTRFTVLGVV